MKKRKLDFLSYENIFTKNKTEMFFLWKFIWKWKQFFVTKLFVAKYFLWNIFLWKHYLFDSFCESENYFFVAYFYCYENFLRYFLWIFKHFCEGTTILCYEICFLRKSFVNVKLYFVTKIFLLRFFLHIFTSFLWK